MRRRFRLKNQVAAFLVNVAIAKMATKSLG